MMFLPQEPCTYPGCRHASHDPRGSFKAACVDFFQNESKLMLKFFSHAAEVFPMIRSVDEPTKLLCGRINVITGDGAKGISVASIPRQLGLVVTAGIDWAHDPTSLERIRDLVCNQMMSLGDLFCDGIDLMSRHVYPISPQAMRVVEGASGFCALVMSVNGLFDNYREVCACLESEASVSNGKKFEIGSKVGANFSFALFGGLALASASAVVVVASWMITVCLVIGLACTLFVFFAERMNHCPSPTPPAALVALL